MRMWRDVAESLEDVIGTRPGLKSCVHDEGEPCQRRELAIVEQAPSQELPDPFDRVKLGAVRWEEEQREIGLLGQTPSRVERGVVVAGVVDDDDHAAAGAGTDPTQVAKEGPAGLGVEAAGRRQIAELSVTQAHSPEVADGLAGRSVSAHWVPDFGRNPHAAAASVLLEMNLIQRPQINPRIDGQRLEFFYCRLRCRIGLPYLRPRRVQSKTQSPEESLALAHLQGHAQLLFQEGRQQRTIP